MQCKPLAEYGEANDRRVTILFLRLKLQGYLKGEIMTHLIRQSI